MKHSSVRTHDEAFNLLYVDKKGCNLKAYNSEIV